MVLWHRKWKLRLILKWNGKKKHSNYTENFHWERVKSVRHGQENGLLRTRKSVNYLTIWQNKLVYFINALPCFNRNMKIKVGLCRNRCKHYEVALPICNGSADFISPQNGYLDNYPKWLHLTMDTRIPWVNMTYTSVSKILGNLRNCKNMENRN